MQTLGPALDLVSQTLQRVFDKQAQGVVSSPMALNCPFIPRVGEGSQASPRLPVGQGRLVMVPCAVGKSALWASEEMQNPGCALQKVPPWKPSYPGSRFLSLSLSSLSAPQNWVSVILHLSSPRSSDAAFSV